MKTNTTMYQALLSTGVGKEIAVGILAELEVDQQLALSFEPGALLMTNGVETLQELGMLNSLPYLIRHLICDWGNLDASNWVKNLQSLQDGGLLVSTYCTGANDEICLYICTATRRTQTLVLLADELDLIRHMHKQR